jgi:Do/DeqQ family serine protease
MKSRLVPVVITAAITSIITLFIAGRYQSLPIFAQGNNAVPVRLTSFNSMGSTNSAPGGFETAAESAVKAVVHIKTTTKARTITTQPDPNDLWGNIFGQRQYYYPPQMGSGSGVVISPDGYIVTNNHVIANASEVTVTFNDRLTAQAKVIGTDPASDIALIKIERKDLPFIDFGNSDDVRLGQWVLAVGYPLSLDATVTAGIVSAKSRSIGVNKQTSGAIESYIQTDAAVNPGNSGGALVNTAGQLIGINSAIASPTGSYAGYSYAIPANIVHKVVGDIIKYGSVQRGYMGISYVDSKSLSPEKISELGLDKTPGVYVEDVTENGGAAKAGLHKGDIITQINGVKINDEPALQEQIARYHPGDNISVAYLRSGTTHTANVELKTLTGANKLLHEGVGDTRFLGASVRALNNSEKSKYNVKSGLVVTDMGKGLLAKQTNMQKGFVITGVNNEEITDVKDLHQALQANSNNIQIMGFYPGVNSMYYFGLNITGQDLQNEE